MLHDVAVFFMGFGFGWMVLFGFRILTKPRVLWPGDDD